MFAVAELTTILASQPFREDYSVVRSILSKTRIRQRELFAEDAAVRLEYFVESVLASATNWNGTDSQPAGELCRIAAEISEVLALRPGNVADDVRRRARLRSALLYELGDQPAMSSAVILSNDVPDVLLQFFARKGPFRTLGDNSEEINGPRGSFAEFGLQSDMRRVGEFLQGGVEDPAPQAASHLLSLAKELAIGLSATELEAFTVAMRRRIDSATRSNVSEELFEDLRLSHFPVELWQSQRAALRAGILDDRYDSWGIAAPTGTGKTFLSRLLILNTLDKKPNDKILYIVPSRALVYEVESNLTQALAPFGYAVTAVTPQLVEVDEDESDRIEESSVLVLTPEKADMLLRLGGVFQDLSLVIVDEAHHIESSTRGILLEMYLWRLRSLTDRTKTRFIFLSAVAPNIGDIVKWMGTNPNSTVVSQRPTRMRAGVYEITGTGKKAKGLIRYTDGTILDVIPSGMENGQKRRLIQLAATLGLGGPILVVAKGKGECETLAKLMADYLELHPEHRPERQVSNPELLERLDSRLEREMYPAVSLRALVRKGVAYHHAGLPPRVRTVLEDSIRKSDIHFVFATTTLAEGVNFPFATVLVQSIALREQPQVGRPSKYHPITPRVFWNIAGRAGRPFFDSEGQVILFGPTLGLDKVNAVLGDYLNPQLAVTQPVVSALGLALKEIINLISSGDISSDQLGNAALSPEIPGRVRGAINNIRVSLLHARASHLPFSPEEIFNSTFAQSFLDGEQKLLAMDLFRAQSQIVEQFLRTQDPSMATIAAEIGLSIETLLDLHSWVVQLEEWQFANLHRIMFGGEVNPEQAKWVLGPIASRMAELEGKKLGGMYSDIILQWLLGIPFATIRPGYASEYVKRVEDLISVVYSRVQYLLPWGLYAADRLVEVEAKRRRINYDNELRSLAYLVDVGVPSFDALRLVNTDFERTDASRIASYFRQLGGIAGLGTDLVGWLANLKYEDVVDIVRGSDNRKPDIDLKARLGTLAAETE